MPEGSTFREGQCLSGGHRHADDGVRAESLLVRGSVELHERFVEIDEQLELPPAQVVSNLTGYVIDDALDASPRITPRIGVANFGRFL